MWWSRICLHEELCAIYVDAGLTEEEQLDLNSGHANGTPENDDIQRYSSIGGYYILIANPEVSEGKAVV